MIHKIDKYIIRGLNQHNWQDKILVDKSGISKGQISKLKNGMIEKLSAETFYLLVNAFQDDFAIAIPLVYPSLKNYNLRKHNHKKRNTFGSMMYHYEQSKNTLEEIAAKTGISETRLSELYYRKGALEAYELIIIEKALGLKEGELFKKLYHL